MGGPADRDPAARPPLHRAQRRADRGRTSTSATSPSTACRGRTTSPRHPAGTSAAVRRVMNESFTTGAGGLPGNDDLGATSAWYVWAALGMYPPTPGADTLALHGPLFPSILIAPAGRRHHDQRQRRRPGAQYVQSLSRSTARRRSRNWLRYADIARRRDARLHHGRLARRPGAPAPADVPPSFTDGCAPAARRAGPRHQPGAGPARDRLGRRAAPPRPRRRRWTAARRATASGARRRPARSSCRWTSARRRTCRRSWSSTPGSAARTPAGTPARSPSRPAPTAPTFTTGGDGHRQPLQPHLPPDHAGRARGTSGSTSPRRPTTATTRRGSTSSRCTAAAAAGPTNVALNKPATGRLVVQRQRGAGQGGQRQRLGRQHRQVVLAGRRPSSCRSTSAASQAIQSFTVRHAGAGGESAAWNTRDFDLQVSADGTNWTTVVPGPGQHRQRHQPHRDGQRPLRPDEHHHPDPDDQHRRPHLRTGGLRVTSWRSLRSRGAPAGSGASSGY